MSNDCISRNFWIPAFRCEDGFTKVYLDQSGMPPPKSEVAKLAEEMRLSLAPDFQALELFKMTEARLKTHGMDFIKMEEALAWQVESMLAFANDRLPPPMPASLTQIAQAGGAGAPGGAGFGGASGFGGAGTGGGSMAGVTALPFVEGAAAVSSPIVRAELDSLARDHRELVRLGESYGRWDRAGRLAYIDQLEAVEERWGVFLKRFELMGELNPEFVRQTEEYLRRLDVAGADEFRALLKTCRDIMRADAERI